MNRVAFLVKSVCSPGAHVGGLKGHCEIQPVIRAVELNRRVVRPKPRGLTEGELSQQMVGHSGRGEQHHRSQRIDERSHERVSHSTPLRIVANDIGKRNQLVVARRFPLQPTGVIGGDSGRGRVVVA